MVDTDALKRLTAAMDLSVSTDAMLKAFNALSEALTVGGSDVLAVEAADVLEERLESLKAKVKDQ